MSDAERNKRVEEIRERLERSDLRWLAPVLVDDIAFLLAERNRPANEATTLRFLMWKHHGHHALYGDDGEMQCQQCPLDYKRADVQEIEALWFAKSPIPQIRQRALEECLAATDAGLAAYLDAADGPGPQNNRTLGATNVTAHIKAAIRKLMGGPPPDAEEHGL